MCGAVLSARPLRAAPARYSARYSALYSAIPSPARARQGVPPASAIADLSFDAAMDTAPPPAKGKKLFNSGSVSKPDEDYDAEPSAADRGARTRPKKFARRARAIF